MKLRVLLFAAARQIAGTYDVLVELQAGDTAGAAKRAVVAAHPGLAALSAQLRVAVNHALVDDATVLGPDDEVALLPPVSGGQGGYARVLAEPLSLGRVVDRVSDEEHGAVATFSGMVRRTSHGKRVTRLDYEAYVPMAERVMLEIAAEIGARRPSVRLAMEHRVGALEVGQLAVVIAAGAPHRREALVACDEAIEALKARAPIWKREHTEDGAEWVGCDGCAPAVGSAQL